MQLSTAGTMIWQWWEELNRKFPTARTDVVVVMPNHFHGIIVIDPPQQAQNDVGAILSDRPVDGQPHSDGQPRRAAPTEKPPSLGGIVGWFKTMTTNAYIRGVRQQGWPPFQGAVWQRNYYEHVIRQEQAIEQIREYIQANPARWTWDRENLQRTGLDQMELWIFSSPPDKGLS